MRNSLPEICVAVLVAAMSSCSQPRTAESFVKTSDAGPSGRYEYVLDMTDTLARYDIYFYTRLDVDDSAFGAMGDIPVNVFLVAPDGVGYSETVYISKTSFSGKSGSKDCDVPYRRGFAPVVYGNWTLFLTVNPDTVPGLRGMGVRVERK